MGKRISKNDLYAAEIKEQELRRKKAEQLRHNIGSANETDGGDTVKAVPSGQPVKSADAAVPKAPKREMPEGLRRYHEQRRMEKLKMSLAQGEAVLSEEPPQEFYTVNGAAKEPEPAAPPVYEPKPSIAAETAEKEAAITSAPPQQKQLEDAPGYKTQGNGAVPASEYAPHIMSNYAPGEIVLKVSGLTKRFGARVAVNKVSFDVRAGEIFGFLGPNGAGKTTTIRMVSGLASITEGEVEICGISVKKDFKRAVANIGGIIENPEMYKYTTGWDNLKYYASLYDGISDGQIMDVVRLVRMEKRIHEKVKRYSLGMRQRVGIAQSLLHNPKILMLDEPTNGLDPAGIHEMRDFLKMLAHERGIAVFISSHILTEMQLMCDRVGIVSNGNLVAIKTIDEWTAATEATRLIKLSVTDPQGALRVLRGNYPSMEVQLSGRLLIFNLPQEELGGLSIRLADSNIGVLSLAIGEKTLEETFLELTGIGSIN